jgi:uncharacterized membrane protein YcaP (DUF421 family)
MLPELGSNLLDIVVRTAIVYGFLFVAIRLSGKRQVGQLSLLELIVILIISDAVQNSMVGENTSIWGGLVAVATLITIDRVVSRMTDRSVKLRRLVEGEPRILIWNGTIQQAALLEEGIALDEIQAAVRAHGLATTNRVQLAVLETDGSISVVGKADHPPGFVRPAERP